ncbi:hemolysin III family protein [Weissella diestrammenae]|uniref:Hemolysin III family protein n=1 Tax=Weissella diestrammenae TaxID=1162633 RepID=A0A7G9T4A0_9LACO|nr:hemolysin III family protein [Weissella diestrammenae]MCM0583456.1 hemolysin III family protein [Weissella diestrammenae]QNN74925.1 hemolysin III family protein [Weissella diestrammenae]
MFENVQVSRRALITYEVLNSVTHGLGFIWAVIASVVLLVQGSIHHMNSFERSAIVIYIIGLTTFLLASTLFHALIFTKAARLFQIFDHSGIYLVILGTYTPFVWIAMHNTTGYLIWTILALLTIGGIVYDVFLVGRFKWLSTTIYLIMGWMMAFVFPTLWQAIPHSAFWLLVVGGVTYSVGALVYMKKHPASHLIWHFFVLAATLLMYASVYITLFAA